MTSLNLSQLDVKCKLKKPVEVGCFSMDNKKQIHFDRSQLKCIVDHVRTGRVFDEVDLNDGYKDRYIQIEELTGIDKMLRWMLENKDRFYLPDSGPKEGVKNIIGEYPDFVTWSRCLTTIMCTPFESRRGWSINCRKLDKTIYMVGLITEGNCDSSNSSEEDGCLESEFESESESESDSESKELMELLERSNFWGQRFKAYMTRPSSSPDEKKPVVDQKTLVIDQHQRFYSVMSSNLNQHHSLLYGCRIDCCDPSRKPPDCYIDLRTNRVFSSRRQEENFYRYKGLQLWSHSYVTGIAETICGFRNDNGMLRTIDRFYTAEFPKFARQLRYSWNPVKCLNFLDTVLSDIKKGFESFKSKKNVELFLSWSPGDKKVTYIYFISPRNKGLPEWYVKEMSSLVTQDFDQQQEATKDLQ